MLSDTLRGLELVDDVIALIVQYARGRKLVIFGGCDKLTISSWSDDGKASQHIESYDPTSNTWSVLNARWPGATLGAGIAVLDGRVHFCGGIRKPTKHTSLCLESGVMVTEQDLWSRRACFALAVAGQLTVIGNAQEPLLRLKAEGTWTPRHMSPWWHSPNNSCVAQLGPDMYAIHSTGWVQRYDAQDGLWVHRARLISARQFAAATGAEDSQALYVCGGMVTSISGGSYTRSCERYCPVSNSWQFIADMHNPRAYAAAAFFDGRLYVCGGRNDDNAWRTQVIIKDVESYNPNTDRWTVVAPMPSDRVLATALVVRQ
jgi:hypothetical protein